MNQTYLGPNEENIYNQDIQLPPLNIQYNAID
jgi:hypothetical protein